MEAEGIEPNIIMLNVLINAFGVAGRQIEALSIYDHMKESVRLFLLLYIYIVRNDNLHCRLLTFFVNLILQDFFFFFKWF